MNDMSAPNLSSLVFEASAILFGVAAALVTLAVILLVAVWFWCTALIEKMQRSIRVLKRDQAMERVEAESPAIDDASCPPIRRRVGA